MHVKASLFETTDLLALVKIRSTASSNGWELNNCSEHNCFCSDLTEDFDSRWTLQNVHTMLFWYTAVFFVQWGCVWNFWAVGSEGDVQCSACWLLELEPTMTDNCSKIENLISSGGHWTTQRVHTTRFVYTTMLFCSKGMCVKLLSGSGDCHVVLICVTLVY